MHHTSCRSRRTTFAARAVTAALCATLVVGALPGQASADVDERASTALLSSLLFGVPVALLAGWGASTVAYMNADSAVDYPYGWETLKGVGGGLGGGLCPWAGGLPR